MIKAVIFDMGSVVLMDAKHYINKKIQATFHMNFKKIHSVMKKYLPDLQKDYIDVLTFWRRVCKDINVNIPDRVLKQIYLKQFIRRARPKKSMLSLIQQLKQHYKIGLISNTINDCYQHALAQGWYDIFDVAIISVIVKLRKPERKIYELALEKLCVKPYEAVIIDDEASFLVPAKKLGIYTIHFTSVKKLKQELKSLEVL